MIQQLRVEVNETVSGRKDMLNSIDTALQDVSAKPIVSKPWSDEGQTLLVSVESTDRFDNSALAVDCSEEEFKSIEASLYQVLHRPTANEPLKIAQQTKRTKGIRSVARDRKDL